MPYQTKTAVELPENQWIPVGFKFVVTDEMKIEEPILLYLADKCIVSGKIKSVGNTQTTYCAHLVTFFSYLEDLKEKMDWTEVELEDIAEYANAMTNGISARGKPFEPSTIRPRVGTVIDFYRWAYNELPDLGTVDVKDEKKLRKISKDRNPLAHISRNKKSIVNALMPKYVEENDVKTLNQNDLVKLINSLGSDPFDVNDDRPSRDRLIAKTCYLTGIRSAEALGLTAHQILELEDEVDLENDYVIPLKITKTKGGVARNVLLPLDLRDELIEYIQTERHDALMAGKKSGLKNTSRYDYPLFLNGLSSGSKHVGKPYKYQAYYKKFVNNQIKIGLYKVVNLVDRKNVKQHDFTPHHLRHSFAVSYYFGMVKGGNSEPWKSLQVLLGHKYLATTLNTYLKYIGTEEARLSDAYLKTLKQMSEPLKRRTS